MSMKHPRMIRENKTIAFMVKIYCKSHHGTAEELCQDCTELLNYARLRLEKCPYQEQKPTCANCPIHCYKPGMRDKMKAVMRFSGPRMLFRHPGLAVLHLMDGLRKATK